MKNLMTTIYVILMLPLIAALGFIVLPVDFIIHAFSVNEREFPIAPDPPPAPLKPWSYEPTPADKKYLVATSNPSNGKPWTVKELS